MNKRIYAIALLTLLSNLAFGSEFNGVIAGEGLRFSTGASPIRVSISVSQATACPTSGWYAYENAGAGLPSLWTTALIAAKTHNRQIKIVGTGKCDNSGIEEVNFIDLK